MKSFRHLTGISLQGALYYRIAFFIQLISPLLLIVGQFALWTTLFRSGGPVIGGYQRNEMYTHLLLAFVIQNTLTWSSENVLSREIRSGTITARIIRPTPFIVQSLADMTGKMIPQMIINVSLATGGMLLFSQYFVFPTLQNFLLAVASYFCGILLRMMMTSFVSLLGFFTTSHLGISWTQTALTEFFSGAIVPLLLFPSWLFKFAYFTPFPFMLQAPITLFMGGHLPVSLWQSFIVQIGWSIIFLLLHQILYRRIRRNLSVAGG